MTLSREQKIKWLKDIEAGKTSATLKPKRFDIVWGYKELEKNLYFLIDGVEVTPEEFERERENMVKIFGASEVYNNKGNIFGDNYISADITAIKTSQSPLPEHCYKFKKK